MRAGARRRPSRWSCALSATPSSIPAKIRNRVAAKCQVKSSIAEQHDADAADRDRPGQIVAGPGTFVCRDCHIGSFSARFRQHSFDKRARIKRGKGRRFDAGASRCQSDEGKDRDGRGRLSYESEVGRAARILAVLVIGDQIRINRPGHKYRLAVEVKRPKGSRSASGVHGRSSRQRLQPRRAHPHHGRCRVRRSRRRQESGGAARASSTMCGRSRRNELSGVARLQAPPAATCHSTR